MEIWQFIQNQILGMQWLNALVGRGLAALGMDPGTRLGGSIQFFLYDTLKITVLLCVLIFGISYLQSYFPPQRSKRILGRFRGLTANLMAAQLGTVLSFMMAVTTLSLPSLILLRKVVRPKLLALFVGVCVVGIVLVGYFFNLTQYLLI